MDKDLTLEECGFTLLVDGVRQVDVDSYQKSPQIVERCRRSHALRRK